MTARLRRGSRRRKSYKVSAGMAAIWRDGLAFMGPFAAHLLVQSRLREMVALALFLGLRGRRKPV